jgi:hypothetical protein
LVFEGTTLIEKPYKIKIAEKIKNKIEPSNMCILLLLSNIPTKMMVLWLNSGFFFHKLLFSMRIAG